MRNKRNLNNITDYTFLSIAEKGPENKIFLSFISFGFLYSKSFCAGNYIYLFVNVSKKIQNKCRFFQINQLFAVVWNFFQRKSLHSGRILSQKKFV